MITFRKFNLGDVEDPEIYAAQPIWEWEQSEHGKWCKEHSTVPVAYRIVNDFNTYGYRVDIYGDLDEHNQTFYKLKWGNTE